MKIVVVGSGVGGLAAACLLGKAGHHVTVLEKNEQLGGRAGQVKASGFTFDTGPSWYLMPGVFAHFFELLGEDVHDHLDLVRLSPSFRVRFAGDRTLTITGDHPTDAAMFESIEPGAGRQFDRFTRDAARLHRKAMRVASQDMNSVRALRIDDLAPSSPLLLTPMKRYVERYFADPRLQKIVSYPLVFVGANPYRAPALYGLLNHATLNEGVFYPKGGMYELIRALVAIGKRHGVIYQTDAEVSGIRVAEGRAAGVQIRAQEIPADAVISDAGIWHTETALLAKQFRDHTPRYWRRRTLAPSALLMHLGVERTYASLAHHNLVFSNDWRRNFRELESGDSLPSNPSFYVCAPTKTDPGVAPKDCENLFVLVPVAAGLHYTGKQLSGYAEKILATMEQELSLPGLRQHIVYQKLFCAKDFAIRFHSPSGTGLGLAHTLGQSAFLRPKNASKKVTNLFYVGADTHPGIGLPPVLLSAEILCRRLS